MRTIGTALLCLLAGALAQEPREAIRGGLFMELSQPQITLDVDPEGDVPFFDYRANPEPQFGVELRYGRYALSMAPSLFGEGRLNVEHPPTRYFDLKGGYFGDRWAFEGYHQYFRGFYLEHEESGFRRDNSSLVLQATDVNVYRTLGLGSRMFRVTEGIRGTGARFNLYGLGSVSRLALRSPFPLLEGQPEADGGTLDSMQRIQAYTFSLGLGTTLNLNLGGFYLDPTFMLGAGPQYRVSDARIDAWSGALKIHLKLGLGYANDDLEVGVHVQNDANDADFGDSALLFHSAVVRMGFLAYFD